MAIQITPKVCARARSLLKWNVNELAKESNLVPKDIESFERGVKRLMRPQNDALFKTFKDNGIRFKDNMEVELVEEGKMRRVMSSARPNIRLEEQTYTVDDMESLVSQYFATKQSQDENR